MESTNRLDYYFARAAIDAYNGAVSAALKNLKKADELSPKNTDVRRGFRTLAGPGDPEPENEEADRRPASNTGRRASTAAGYWQDHRPVPIFCQVSQCPAVRFSS